MKEIDMRVELGWRIQRTRKEKGWTQERLAKSIRVSRPTLVNIEKGIQGLSVWRLLQICTALNTDPSHFLSASNR